MPWLMVRLPCGSRSTQSTRWPRSTKAAARLRVVVVFATPPFWLVKAMTLALGVITRAVFARAERNPSPLSSGAFATGQAARARDGQGRRRQDDRRRRARAGRGAPRQAHGGVRGGRAGAARRDVRGERRRPRRARAGPRPVRRLGRPASGRRRSGSRYQLRSATLAGLLGGSRVFQYLTAAAPGLTELVTIGKVWDLAQLERRTGRLGLRPGDRRRARHRTRRLRCCARRRRSRHRAGRGRSLARRSGSTPSCTTAPPPACWWRRCPRRCRSTRRIELRARAPRRARAGRRRDRRQRAATRQRFSAAEARALASLDGQRRARRAGGAARRALGARTRPRPSALSCAGCAARSMRPCRRCRTSSSRSSARDELERLSAELERRL